MWVYVGSKTTPVFIVLDTDALAEDSAHILSKANIWDFVVDLRIAMVVSANVIRIGQDAFDLQFQRNQTRTRFSEPPTFRGYHRRILGTRDRTFGGNRIPYEAFGITVVSLLSEIVQRSTWSTYPSMNRMIRVSSSGPGMGAFPDLFS